MDLICSDFPCDANPERLECLRLALTSPPPRAVPIIFDNDSFRAIFHGHGVIDTEPSLPYLPPQPLFDEIYRKYHNGFLIVLSPDSPRILGPDDPRVSRRDDRRLTAHDSARRLFSNVKGVRPDGVKLFEEKNLFYNGWEVAWRLFECIVQYFGDRLDSNHSNIDWVRVAMEMGRPFEIDPNFPRHLCQYYYEFVAPVVSLWLWERRIEQAKLRVHERFTREGLPRIESNYSQSCRTRIMHTLQLIWSMLALNEELGGSPAAMRSQTLPDDFKVGQIDNISQLMRSTLRDGGHDVDLVAFIEEISRTKELRAITRLLPSRLALQAMNVVQWVLAQDRSATSERPKIKLLQDLANESGQFLDGMQLAGVTLDPVSAIHGGESKIMFGHIDPNKEVAIRVPHVLEPERRGPPTWVKEKIYKRVVILHQQIEHENIIKVLGLYDYNGSTSIVMPRMQYSVYQHVMYPGSSVRSVSYGRLTAGVINGLSYLHHHHVVHGDFHWDNLLIDNSGSPKIADLGMSRVLHPEGNSTSTEPNSSAFKTFMPSEILEDHEKASEKNTPRSVRPERSTDIYSCGVMLLALALPEQGRIVGSTKPRMEAFAKSFIYEYTVEPPEELLRIQNGRGRVCGIWELILEMTSRRADRRPNIDVVSKSLSQLQVLQY